MFFKTQAPPQNNHCLKEPERFKNRPVSKSKRIFTKNPHAPPQVNNQWNQERHYEIHMCLSYHGIFNYAQRESWSNHIKHDIWYNMIEHARGYIFVYEQASQLIPQKYLSKCKGMSVEYLTMFLWSFKSHLKNEENNPCLDYIKQKTKIH